jgi:hypothetical protein
MVDVLMTEDEAKVEAADVCPCDISYINGYFRRPSNISEMVALSPHMLASWPRTKSKYASCRFLPS